MKNSLYYKKLNDDNFTIRSLDNFIWHQDVYECWRKKDGKYSLDQVRYTENRNINERRAMAKQIITEIKNGGVAYGAFENSDVIAFALLAHKKFGSQNQYLNLAEFYVSEQYRHMGIGRKLFCLISKAATALGAQKLYISAHSAKESIAAYKSYGCVFAREINSFLSEKEPCDLQLEYTLPLRIYQIQDKSSIMPLLLLGDEQESMIKHYIEQSTAFVMSDGEIKAQITVIPTSENTLEIKNISVLPEYQRQGYGSMLIDFVCNKYKPNYDNIIVGTGDSILTIPFYENNGFKKTHTVKNFFVDNYDHPIIENGKQLIDMVYLSKKLN